VEGTPIDLREVPGRTVRGLRALSGSLIVKILSELRSAGTPAERVWIRGGHFTGEMDLEGVVLKCPVIFESCRFERPLTLVQSELSMLRIAASSLASEMEASGMKVTGSVELTGGFEAAGAVDLSDSKIDGALDCSGGRFLLSHPDRPALTLGGAAIGSDVLCGPNFEVRGMFSMSGARVQGKVFLIGGEVRNESGIALHADLIEARGGMAWGRGFLVRGETRLADAQIRGKLLMTGGRFLNPGRTAIEADGLTVSGDLNVGNGFLAEGLVYLGGARIGGSFRASGGQFVEPGDVALHLDNAEVGQSMYFRRGFRALGEVRLVAAQVKGQLSCGEGRFESPHGDALSADAIVIGTDLFMTDNFRARGEVRLLGARVAGQLSIKNAVIENHDADALSADGITVEGGAMLGRRLGIRGGVRFNEAQISGQLEFHGCHISRRGGGVALLTDGMNVQGSLIFGEGTTVEGPSACRRMQVRGGLFISGATFSNPLGPSVLLDGSTISSDFRLGPGVTVEGRLEAHGLRVARNCLMLAAEIRMPGQFALLAQSVTVGGNFICRAGSKAVGEVNFAGIEVAGQLVFDDCSFENPSGISLSLEGGSAAELRLDDDFSSRGEVRLLGMNVKRQVSCAGGKFSNLGGRALVCDGTQIGGSLLLSSQFTAKGMVRMASAKIGEGLVCTDGTFWNPGDIALNLQGAEAGAVLCLGHFHASGEISALGLRVERNMAIGGQAIAASLDRYAWNLQDARISQELRINPERPMFGGVKLKGASVGKLTDGPQAWIGDYEITGLSYGALPEESPPPRRRWWRKDQPLDSRVKWLKGNYSGYQPQLYDKLAQIYETSGDDTRRRRILIEKQRQRRSSLARPERLWSWIEDLLVGYGYRTWKAIIPFMLFFALGTAFFHANGEEIGQKVPTQDPPPFHSYTYTLDLLVPVVNLGQRENWTAHGEAQTVATILVVFGWILTTAIIAALTGLVRRSD
jgi:hypothetical protein